MAQLGQKCHILRVAAVWSGGGREVVGILAVKSKKCFDFLGRIPIFHTSPEFESATLHLAFWKKKKDWTFECVCFAYTVISTIFFSCHNPLWVYFFPLSFPVFAFRGDRCEHSHSNLSRQRQEVEQEEEEEREFLAPCLLACELLQ